MEEQKGVVTRRAVEGGTVKIGKRKMTVWQCELEANDP